MFSYGKVSGLSLLCRWSNLPLTLCLIQVTKSVNEKCCCAVAAILHVSPWNRKLFYFMHTLSNLPKICHAWQQSRPQEIDMPILSYCYSATYRQQKMTFHTLMYFYRVNQVGLKWGQMSLKTLMMPSCGDCEFSLNMPWQCIIRHKKGCFNFSVHCPIWTTSHVSSGLTTSTCQ